MTGLTIYDLSFVNTLLDHFGTLDDSLDAVIRQM